jgi:hypothetical protein
MPSPQRKRLVDALPDTIIGFSAVLASFLTMYAVGLRLSAGPSAAILSAVLALTLARRSPNTHTSPWVTFAMLPAVGVASAFVGLLLKFIPLAGAVLFVAALFISIWLRQFGARAAEIGSLIALPFVVILVVPVRPNAAGGLWVNIALVVCAGLVALGWIAVLRFVAARVGLADVDVATPTPRSQPRAATNGDGLTVVTRMALQMSVALAAAFAIGLVFFPHHWGWLVLTAFIVCSGARGRGDALYKGLLRLGGALAGTIGAALVQHVSLPNGAATACAIFAALFLGMWLRERNYAYWAACITLVLALLQRSESDPGITLLLGRLEGILIGALCGVAATWFVYPIRTESVVRRRVADVLAALDEFFGAGHASADERARKFAIVEHHAAELELVAAPVELHRRVLAHTAHEHPAAWIGIVREVLAHARKHFTDGAERDHEPARRAIRYSRRSIGRRLTP